MDGTPLLVISGNEASRHMETPTRVWGVQGYASTEVAERFTKRASRAMWPRQAMVDLNALTAEALAHPQGPVWLDIPKDLQNAEL